MYMLARKENVKKLTLDQKQGKLITIKRAKAEASMPIKCE